jgi:hypothetical protein
MTAGVFLGSIINRLKPKRSKTKRSPMRKEIINLNLSKQGMTSLLRIKVAEEIEDYFRKASLRDGETGSDNRSRRSTRGNTDVSEKWLDESGEGLEFYKKNVKLSNKVSRYTQVIDNFGNGLIDDGRLNLALLRVKGISEGDGVSIKTDDLLGYAEMQEYITQLSSWTKAFYEDHLRDQDIVAKVTFEVE